MTRPSGGTETRRDPVDGDPSLDSKLDTDPGLDGDIEAERTREAARRRLFGRAATIRIGRFTVLDFLGSGAMGVVYSAYDPKLDRKVAVKILRHEGELGSEPDATPRLLREAQALARISHPNVVAVYEVGTHDDQVFVAMEFIRGVTLRRWLDDGDRDWRAVLDLYLQAGRGLAAAHEVGLVHRDFKPDNVIVDEQGRARVLDFGLARAAASPDPAALGDDQGDLEPTSRMLGSAITQTGAVVGTPAYMSPEQHAGAQAEASSDQFSFCVATWEALTGQRPFAGTSLAELMINVQRGSVLPVRAKHMPAELFTVLRRGLAVAPADRFASMHALLVGLDRIRNPTRRRFGPAVVLGGLGVTVTVAAMLRTDDAATNQDLCGGAASELQGAWDDDRRASVRSAFAATKLSYAPSSLTRVEAALDAYVAAWITAHEQSCRATQIRADRSPALLDRSMSCLEKRRDGLSAVVDRLADADPAVVERSLDMVAALDPIAPCLDRAMLLSEVPPPSDPTTRARVDEARRRLADTRSLREAGKYAAAGESAARSEELDGSIDHPPLAAELALERGRIHAAAGEYDDARTALRRAYWTAVDARHDRIAVDAAVGLASVIGVEGARTDEGLGWARQAETIVRRSDLGDDARASVLMARAGVLDKGGAYVQAVAEYEAALPLMSPDSPRRFELHGALGTAALHAGSFDAARRHHEQALELARARFGPEHPEVAGAIYDLGAVEYGQGRFEAALEAFEAARVLYERLLGPDHPHVSSTLNGIAVVLDDFGRPAEAIAAYERSLVILRRVHGDDHPAVAARMGNLASALSRVGRHDEAEQMMARAIAIMRATLGPQHPDLAIALHGAAQLAFRRDRFEQAAAFDREALAIWEASLGSEHPDVASALISLCSTMMLQGKDAEAIGPCERGLRIRETKSVGPLLVAEARLRLGTAMWWAHVDRERARELLGQARAGFADDPAGVRQLPGIDEALEQMGIVVDEAER